MTIMTEKETVEKKVKQETNKIEEEKYKCYKWDGKSLDSIRIKNKRQK